MANAPHGGILKVCTDSYFYALCAYTTLQDLVARDEPKRDLLKAEAKTLPDLVLTDVSIADKQCISCLTNPSFNSVNYVT